MRQLEAGGTADQHHVESLTRGGRIRILRQHVEARRLTQTAAQAVARSGALQLTADGHAHPPAAIGIGYRECDHSATGKHSPTAQHAVEVSASLEAKAPLHSPGQLPPLAGVEPAAAPSAPVLQNPPASRRIHAPEEAVDATPVTLFRLVRAFDG